MDKYIVKTYNETKLELDTGLWYPIIRYGVLLKLPLAFIRAGDLGTSKGGDDDITILKPVVDIRKV